MKNILFLLDPFTINYLSNFTNLENVTCFVYDELLQFKKPTFENVKLINRIDANDIEVYDIDALIINIRSLKLMTIKGIEDRIHEYNYKKNVPFNIYTDIRLCINNPNILVHSTLKVSRVLSFILNSNANATAKLNIGIIETLEKDRLTKDKLEKERLEKERLEKKRLEKEKQQIDKAPDKATCNSNKISVPVKRNRTTEDILEGQKNGTEKKQDDETEAQLQHIDHNMYYDFVYIINLEKNKINYEKCIIQMKKYGFKNFKVVNAVNGKHVKYGKLYDSIVQNMDPEEVLFNFQKGALGCLLSHLYCINDAKINNYEKILVLEDDFEVVKDYEIKIANTLSHVPTDWELIYLGKKQTSPLSVNRVNDHFYNPNKFTFATHALYIKNSMFDKILSIQNEKIKNPIDLHLQTLFMKAKCYAVYSDLFISDDTCSDVQINDRSQITWGWNTSLYDKIQSRMIENIIVFGFKKDNDHTHNYIHKMYYLFLKYYFKNVNVHFLDEDEIEEEDIQSNGYKKKENGLKEKEEKKEEDTEETNSKYNNSIIFCSPCHHQYKKYINGKNNYYVFHLDSEVDDKDIKDFYTSIKNVKMNDSITLVCRENINKYPLKYFEEDISNKMICLPWFSKELYTDTIALNSSKIYEEFNKNKWYLYFGSIWQDNILLIQKLIKVCIRKNIHLVMKGRVFGLNEEEMKFINQYKDGKHPFIHLLLFNYTNDKYNTFDYLKSVYDIKYILTLQGKNKKTYFSNRTLENCSKGYLAITNSPVVKKNLKSSIYYDDNSLDDMFSFLEHLYKDKNLYTKILDAQRKEYLEMFYGYYSITKALDFLKKSVLNHTNVLLTFPRNEPFKIWFCADSTYQNKFFQPLTKYYCPHNQLYKIDHLDKVNIIIKADDFLYNDKCSIHELTKNIYSTVYIDADFPYLQEVSKLLTNYNKTYSIKNVLKKNVCISGQRTGSTMIVDCIQKLSNNVLALSEILYFLRGNETYHKHYDIVNENGVLYNSLLANTFVNLNKDNFVEYLKQFEDYAVYENKDVLFFKYTLDFTVSPMEHDLFFDALEYLKSNAYNILNLKRDNIDCFISKKAASIYGYSHNTYTALSLELFQRDEYLNFVANEKSYQQILLPYLNPKIIRDYNQISRNIVDEINNLLCELNDTPNKNYLDKLYYNLFLQNAGNMMLEKQNKLNAEQIKQIKLKLTTE